MAQLLLGLVDGVALLEVEEAGAQGRRVLEAGPVPSVAVDPLAPSRLYAATRGQGFWRSRDGGRVWEQAGEGIDRPLMTLVGVSRSHRPDGVGAVFVGTELTALYRSLDGGETFTELSALQDVPSRPSWSFPPRPDTNHLQSFTADPNDADLLFVGIEVGGVMRSSDGGESWEDHNPEVDGDPHTLLTHPHALGRVYVGGGATYCQSADSGLTWSREYADFPDDVRYFYALAVDPGDPERAMIVSGRDHISGHGLIPGVETWSTLYGRREGGHWEELRDGLPPREGTAMGCLATDGETPGLFFYSTVDGDVYRSLDAGVHWDQLRCEWSSPPAPRSVLSITATRG